MVSCTSIQSSLKQTKYFQTNFNSKVYLNTMDENPVNLDSVYLDPKNISKITFDKASNSLLISQKNPTAKLFPLSEIDLEKLSRKGKLKAIILNGEFLKEKDLKNIKLEETVIKEIKIIRNNDMHKGDSMEIENLYLIIRTRN
jgi:hypothetical protein